MIPFSKIDPKSAWEQSRDFLQRQWNERIGTREQAMQLRRFIDDISRRRFFLSASQLTRELARASSVQALSVALDPSGIRIHAEVDDTLLDFGFRPTRVSFAPRGAKEIAFAVEPNAMSEHPAVRRLVGSAAALIAHALWAPVLGSSRRQGAMTAFVDRVDAELIVDLRSVPAIRQSLLEPGRAPLIELLGLSALEVSERGLGLCLQLPGL